MKLTRKLHYADKLTHFLSNHLQKPVFHDVTRHLTEIEITGYAPSAPHLPYRAIVKHDDAGQYNNIYIDCVIKELSVSDIAWLKGHIFSAIFEFENTKFDKI